MEIANIIAALGRNRFGAIMVVAQVALTLAIVSNTMFIGAGYLRRLQTPSGLDEVNIFSITAQWSGPRLEPHPEADVDLKVLREMPDVLDAYVTNFLPMDTIGEAAPVALDPDWYKTGGGPVTMASDFWVDEHALQTLGLRLTSGRWFRPDEVVKTDARPQVYPAVVISQALANDAFPGGDAIGKRFYMMAFPMTVVGVIERMTGSTGAPLTGSRRSMYEHAVLVPYRRPTSRLFVVRARPGRLATAMREADRQLRVAHPLRPAPRIQPFSDVRWEGLRKDRSVVLMFSAVCLLLLAITALGIVGVTTFWISQRQHQIGMRRALGARRHHILMYYQTENLLVVGLGTAIGVALAVGLNLWLMKSYEIERMDGLWIAGGAVLVLALGQLAAFWPARRAASIPPALATRAS